MAASVDWKSCGRFAAGGRLECDFKPGKLSCCRSFSSNDCSWPAEVLLKPCSIARVFMASPKLFAQEDSSVDIASMHQSRSPQLLLRGRLGGWRKSSSRWQRAKLEWLLNSWLPAELLPRALFSRVILAAGVWEFRQQSEPLSDLLLILRLDCGWDLQLTQKPTFLLCMCQKSLHLSELPAGRKLKPFKSFVLDLPTSHLRPPLSPEPGLTFPTACTRCSQACIVNLSCLHFRPFSPPEADATPQSDPQNSEAGEGKERMEKEEELYSQYFTFWVAKKNKKMLSNKSNGTEKWS